MVTLVNWTREEIFKTYQLVEQRRYSGAFGRMCRNSLVYRQIADNLCEAGYSRSLKQCRDKIKKLKGEYKKVRDKRETTSEGWYPEWEFFNALDNIFGPKHSTGPPL